MIVVASDRTMRLLWRQIGCCVCYLSSISGVMVFVSIDDYFPSESYSTHCYFSFRLKAMWMFIDELYLIQFRYFIFIFLIQTLYLTTKEDRDSVRLDSIQYPVSIQ